MTSTTSLQAHYDAELDFIDSMVTHLADQDYTRRDLSNQFYTGGNHQPVPPIQDEYWKYIALYKAVLKGDWERAKKFFEKNQAAVTAIINSKQDNALHIAVQAGKKAIHVVKNLVEELMPIEALEHQNVYGQTVLSFAAIVGNKLAAIILKEKHPQLLYIGNYNEFLPVHVAAQYNQRETFEYLSSVTQDEHDGVRPFAGKSGVHLVVQVIFSGYYDEALKLIERYPEIAKLQLRKGLAKLRLPKGRSALSAIASKESAFRSGSHLSFWEKAIYYCVPVKLDKYAKERSRSDIEDPVPRHNLAQTFVRRFCIPVSQRLHAMLYKVLAFLVPHIKHIGKKKQDHCQAVQLVKMLCQQIATLNDYKAYESIMKGPLLSAAKLGINEVVEEILDSFPDAVWFTDDENHYVFELAILHRQEKVFNIIYQMDLCKNLLSERFDKETNNMLHLAGRLAPSSKLNLIPGAALQMQRELQWFKEVEKLVRPQNKLKKNCRGEIPAVLFTKEHKDLVREGEKWMKDAANSCTIVASLIATIAFAAAITGPGGDDDNGLPIFSKESAFFIFAISNALSLFTSVTSLLMFLSILTSRYGESDFLSVLPKRLIIGLVTLFFSITTMMVAFTATLYLEAGKYKERIIIPATIVAIVPICIFTFLQFPLLLDLIYSTSGPSIFGKKNDRPIFLQSPTDK